MSDCTGLATVPSMADPITLADIRRLSYAMPGDTALTFKHDNALDLAIELSKIGTHSPPLVILRKMQTGYVTCFGIRLRCAPHG